MPIEQTRWQNETEKASLELALKNHQKASMSGGRMKRGEKITTVDTTNVNA